MRVASFAGMESSSEVCFVRPWHQRAEVHWESSLPAVKISTAAGSQDSQWHTSYRLTNTVVLQVLNKCVLGKWCFLCVTGFGIQHEAILMLIRFPKDVRSRQFGKIH